MEPKDEIREKINIVELVGEYIQLKPAGSQGMKGLCPFHGEKTPSFHVSHDRQIWHCFGCGEGGDCFSFVMRMEGMSFPEALAHLGKRVGVEVLRLPTVEGNVKQRTQQINELAQRYFRKVLVESPCASKARDYVLSRGIPDDLSETFGIGYAPQDWDAISNFLLKRGFSESELVQSGISLKKKSGLGLIDRFRNRLMIPLRDHHGNVVGFTGRAMPGSDNEGPKYLNSPETPIYHKGKLVFGLDLAKTAIREKGFIVIVEGNLDVVASHKAGVRNVIASSGTALTKEQLELLRRYCETVVFSFDSDAAGIVAAKKGIALARSLGFDVRAAILPDGIKDPDELVQKDALAWQKAVESSVPIMEFLIAHVTRGKNLRSVDDKREIAKDLIPALCEMTNVVEREHWLQIVADLLGLSSAQLRASVVIPTPNIKTSHVEVSLTRTPLSKEEQIRRFLFGYSLGSKELFDKLQSRLLEILKENELWITLYNLAKSPYDPQSQAAHQSFFSNIRSKLTGHPQQDALVAILDSSILMAEESFGDLEGLQVNAQIEDLFTLMGSLILKQKREETARLLRIAEQAGNKEEVTRLLEELQSVKE